MPSIVHWVRAALAHAVATARAYWVWVSWADVALIAGNAVLFAMIATLYLITGSLPLGWVMLGSGVLTGSVVRVATWNARERWQADQRITDQLKTLRAGAPRVVDVECAAGERHRFTYGRDGWVETPARPPLPTDDRVRHATREATA